MFVLSLAARLTLRYYTCYSDQINVMLYCFSSWRGSCILFNSQIEKRSVCQYRIIPNWVGDIYYWRSTMDWKSLPQWRRQIITSSGLRSARIVHFFVADVLSQVKLLLYRFDSFRHEGLLIHRFNTTMPETIQLAAAIIAILLSVTHLLSSNPYVSY